MVRTGGCQCGRIRFSAGELVDNSHICHCRMCQKASGNFFSALVGVPKDQLTWTRGVPATFSSSEGIERGFCPDCGTPLFFHRLTAPHVSIAIGAFDRPGEIPLSFEYSPETRLPQMSQLNRLPGYSLEGGEAVRIRDSNRQHPDEDTENWPV